MAASRLRVFESLDSSPATAPGTARRIGAKDTRRLAALLDALVALGVLERSGGRYRLNEAGRRFLPGPGTVAPRARHLLDHWEAWGRIAGRIGGASAGGGERGYREDFARTMEENSRGRAASVAARFPLPPGARLLDLGCGGGAYGAAWLLSCPGAEVTFCDLPATIPVTRKILRERGIGASRGGARFLGADVLRDPVGGPYDFAWISHVLHGVGPEAVLRILGKVREALAPGGTAAIQEFLPGEDGTEPEGLSFFRLHMAAVTDGGRLYTARELKGLLRKAGFRSVSGGEADGEGVGIVTGRTGRGR
jgi:SAM-dependent methyltransferase